MKWRPSGRKTGQRWEFSCREESSVVTGVAGPPAAETRKRRSPGAGVKTMTPSRFQVPPRPESASQRLWGGPPEASILFNFPSAKKAINRLSGDQKGK